MSLEQNPLDVKNNINESYLEAEEIDLEVQEPRKEEAVIQPEFDKADLEAEIQELRDENLYLSQEFIKNKLTLNLYWTNDIFKDWIFFLTKAMKVLSRPVTRLTEHKNIENWFLKPYYS